MGGALTTRMKFNFDAKIGTEHSPEPTDPREEEMQTSAVYLDPPMPIMGIEIDFEELRTRSKKMQSLFQEFTDAVAKETIMTTEAAKSVPVSDATQRVLVTAEVKQIMAQHRTRKQVRIAREENINEIQKALALRMHTHELMNENISGVLVNKLEPVYIREARTRITYPD